jgi:transcriptional regulator with XRE-family HTH domain
MNIPELPDKNKVGAEIKRLVDEKGASVQDIATAIGKTKTTVRNIFHGEASYELMKKTLNVLDKWES